MGKREWTCPFDGETYQEPEENVYYDTNAPTAVAAFALIFLLVAIFTAINIARACSGC